MTPDPHRPRYHFSPDRWMNDPIPFFWQGAYHIFFQHNPNGALWGDMHWGHAVSRDLVQWKQLPIALAPTPGGPDADGCWTGCVIEHAGTFYAFYTGIPRLEPLRQVQCLATSTDLIAWQKYPGSPLIADVPAGFGPCFRDPCVWREGAAWYMIVGSELPDGRGGAALLYRSDTLTDWQYLHPLCTGTASQTGHDFECPDFFALGDRRALLTSRGRTHWQIGTYSGHRFAAEQAGSTDGDAFYAAKTLVDDAGRRLLFGWIQERRPAAQQEEAGWSGVLSLPRVLTRRPDNTLGIEPAPELTALRGRHRRFEDIRLAGETRLLDGGPEAALEVLVRFAPSDAPVCGVQVRCAPEGGEYAEVACDRRRQRLGDVPLVLAPGEELVLHLFIDGSVMECFANGRACLTQRFYPDRFDRLGIGLFVRGGMARVVAVDLWEIASDSIEQPKKSGDSA